MRICSITATAAGEFELRVYEVHSAASEKAFRRAVSLKIASTEISPPVASLMRFAESYDGLRSPLSTSDRCEAEHFTSSAKATWLMRPSNHAARQCFSMTRLCHWQTPASSPEVCYQEIDFVESLNTIGGMTRAKRKIQLPRPKPKLADPPIKLFIGEWFHNAEIKQTDAAAAIGVRPPYMSTMVNGRRKDGKPANPGYSILIKLSNWMGCTVNDLAKPPPPKEEFDRIRKLNSGQQIIAQVLAKQRR